MKNGKNYLKQNTSLMLIAALIGLTVTGCVKKNSNDGSSTQLLQIQESASQDLSAEAGTADSLCQYLNSQGYAQGNSFPSGTQVAFSTSYGVDTQDSNRAEAGQAHGSVGNDGYFYQKDMTTTQLLICPGALSGMSGGKCLWKMNGDDGYAELAKRVVCNTAGNYGSRAALHPGYRSMKTSKVSFKASTAGKSFTYQDAVKVELAGGSAQTQIYFAKGVGLVATEFRENSSPNGTAKVYFGVPQQSPGSR